MSKKNEAILFFEITPSRVQRRLLTILHLLALIACWLNGLAAVYRLILSCLLVLLWVRNDRAARLARFFLRYTANQGWSISFNGNEYLPAIVKPSTVISPLATIIHLTIDGKGTQSFTVLNDALPEDDYRRLIVGLKLSGYGQD